MDYTCGAVFPAIKSQSCMGIPIWKPAQIVQSGTCETFGAATPKTMSAITLRGAIATNVAAL